MVISWRIGCFHGGNGCGGGRGEGNGDRDFPHGGNGGGVKYIMRVLLTIRTMVITVVLASRREARLIAALRCLVLTGAGRGDDGGRLCYKKYVR